MSASRNDKFDIIIIGSGPAGLSVAHVANQKGLKTLLIEEGGYTPVTQPFSFSEISNHYRAGGQSAILSRTIIPIAQPMVAGGGLAINSGLLQRISEREYGSWHISKVKNWDWKRISNFYDDIENDLQIANEKENSLSELMIGATKKLSWKYHQVKISSLESRLSFRDRVTSEVSHRGGAFLTSSFVSFFEKSGSEWIVYISILGQKKSFRSKKLYLAAGTIQTPAILKRSKLIEKSTFELKYHPVIKAVADFERDFGENNLMSSVQIKEFEKQFTLGSSVSSKGIIAAELSKLEKKFYDRDEIKYKKIFYCQWNKSPRTKIFPFGKSNSDVLYSLDGFSSGSLERGISKLTEFCEAMGAKKILLNSKNISSVHTFSSLAMTEDNQFISVENGSIIDSENIYAVDGSILPASPGVNPQLTIMAFARNIATITL